MVKRKEGEGRLSVPLDYAAVSLKSNMPSSVKKSQIITVEFPDDPF